METRLPFTDDRIGGLAAAPRRYAVQDSKTPGLWLRVEPTGGKSYWLRIRVDGQDVAERLGAPPNMTVEMARKEYQHRRSMLGANGHEARKSAIKRISVAAAWDQYIALNPDGNCAATVQNRRYYFDRHIRKPLGDKYLHAVRPRDIERIKCGIAAGAASGRNANELLVILSLLFKWAIRVEALPEGYPNPVALVKPARVSKGRTRRLHSDEFRAFLGALDEYGKLLHPDLSPGYHQTVADALKVMLFTGARSANVKAMKWCDVNMDLGVWLIPGKATKTRGDYSIPLTTQVKEVLLRRHAGPAGLGEYVFPGKAGKPALGSMRRSFKAICDLAGIDGLTIHDLRRTQGSVQADLGINLALIGEALCHSDIKSTAVYTHAGNMDQLRQNMERANRAMTAQAGADDLALSMDEWQEILQVLGNRPLADKVRRLMDSARVA